MFCNHYIYAYLHPAMLNSFILKPISLFKFFCSLFFYLYTFNMRSCAIFCYGFLLEWLLSLLTLFFTFLNVTIPIKFKVTWIYIYIYIFFSALTYVRNFALVHIPSMFARNLLFTSIYVSRQKTFHFDKHLFGSKAMKSLEYRRFKWNWQYCDPRLTNSWNYPKVSN